MHIYLYKASPQAAVFFDKILRWPCLRLFWIFPLVVLRQIRSSSSYAENGISCLLQQKEHLLRSRTVISSTLRPLTFELYRHRKFPTDADIQRAAKNTTSIYTQNNNTRLGKRPGQCPAKYCKYCLIDYIRFLLLMIRILNHICYYLNMYNQPPIKTFSQEGVPCTDNDAHYVLQTDICKIWSV